MGSCTSNSLCDKAADKDGELSLQKDAQENLYLKYGGESTISKIVDQFYEKVLNDKRVKHFFVNTNMTKQRNHQTNFISFVLGGPKQYTGRSMQAAHSKLSLDDSHFDAIVELLGQTLLSNGVSHADLQTIAAKVEGVRNDVLNK